MFSEIHTELYPLLPFLVFSVGENATQPGTVRPFGFNFHEFIWVKNGECDFSVYDDTFRLREGEGVFMRKKTPHRYSGENLHTSWFTFLGGDGVLDMFGVDKYFRFNVPDSLPDAADSLFKLCMGNSTAVTRSAAGYSFFVDLMNTLFTNDESAEVKVRNFLESNYYLPLSLDEIAESVGMDKFALCRYYKKNCSTSVMEQLRKIRIAKAKKFLRYTLDSIEDIGAMCGYESPSYFTKIFKESTGRTPSEYRSEHSM